MSIVQDIALHKKKRKGHIRIYSASFLISLTGSYYSIGFLVSNHHHCTSKSHKSHKGIGNIYSCALVIKENKSTTFLLSSSSCYSLSNLLLVQSTYQSSNVEYNKNEISKIE